MAAKSCCGLPAELAAMQVVKETLRTRGLKDDTTCIVVDIIPPDNELPPAPPPKKRNKLRDILFRKRSRDSAVKLSKKLSAINIVEELFEEGSAMLAERFPNDHIAAATDHLLSQYPYCSFSFYTCLFVVNPLIVWNHFDNWSRLESFRQLEPFEGHQVRHLSWSPTADRFLCVTGSAQAKVIKPKLSRQGRVPVTTCAWDHDGKCIGGGIGDGSIQIWNIKPGWGSRPDIHIEKCHEDDITGLKFSSDGRILLSRSFDGSLKVWDLRKPKEALKVFEDLPNNYGHTNIAFSPDEQLFFTGMSVERESSTSGLLCFFDRENLNLVSKIGISPTCSVVQCSWHPKLNQILATVGDKSQGGTSFYL